ncbi:MAG: PQQ-dependent sugar dehydrogenase [Caldilineaceae bacterium]|nr:PQQ-dependent sugar dehydrogenase [Caldilineaceae bacterium]
MLDARFDSTANLPAGQINSSRRQRRWHISMILVTTAFALGLLGIMNAYASPGAVTWPAIHLRLIEDGFNNPIEVTHANDGSNRLFVLERGGLVHIVQDGQRLTTPFLDISDRVFITCGECGLLGIAFPPNFAEEGYFFVNYISKTNQVPPDTGDPNTIHDTVIARFHISDDPNVADAASEEPILKINQPASNHNGGHILFGPDEYLYIGMGDGGEGGDFFDNAQNPASLHGKILRIEVGATGTYTVPADNPFVDTQGFRDEIWAWGLRNPWRFHFDRATGDLYIADVGQGNYEEINHIAAADIGNGGQNYGWPIVEGNVCYPPGGAQDCDRTGLTAPVIIYDHANGDCSVTGGFVYASLDPNQAPIYLYGDFCTGRIWGMQKDGAAWATSELLNTDFRITTFGDDETGNVYVVSYDGGEIYQIDEPLPTATPLPTAPPQPTATPTPSSYLPTISKSE